jgi:membrane protein DedA with SNARE-associated domain
LGWVAGGIIASDPWSYGHHYETSVAGTVLVLLIGWVWRMWKATDVKTA